MALNIKYGKDADITKKDKASVKLAYAGPIANAKKNETRTVWQGADIMPKEMTEKMNKAYAQGIEDQKKGKGYQAGGYLVDPVKLGKGGSENPNKKEKVKEIAQTNKKKRETKIDYSNLSRKGAKEQGVLKERKEYNREARKEDREDRKSDKKEYRQSEEGKAKRKENVKKALMALSQGISYTGDIIAGKDISGTTQQFNQYRQQQSDQKQFEMENEAVNRELKKYIKGFDPEGIDLPAKNLILQREIARANAEEDAARGGREMTAGEKKDLKKKQYMQRAFDLYLSFADKVDPNGRVKGIGDVFKAMVGKYPALKQLRDMEGIMATMVAKGIGGDSGNLNNEERKAAQSMLILPTDTEQERENKIYVLKTLSDPNLDPAIGLQLFNKIMSENGVAPRDSIISKEAYNVERGDFKPIDDMSKEEMAAEWQSLRTKIN